MKQLILLFLVCIFTPSVFGAVPVGTSKCAPGFEPVAGGTADSYCCRRIQTVGCENPNNCTVNPPHKCLTPTGGPCPYNTIYMGQCCKDAQRIGTPGR